MNPIKTHNSFHLGDNIIHINFLRRMAKAHPELSFEHKAHSQYLPALQSLIEDLPQIKLVELTEEPTDSIDSWRGCNGFWYTHPLKHDFAAFHIEHFSFIALRMGLPSPILTADDLWMDAPVFDPENFLHDQIDVLLLDCAPHSNQWPGYSAQGFRHLHAILKTRGLRVITAEETRAWKWGIAQIGALAGKAKLIIGTANGPFWTCANVWAKQTVERWVMFTGQGEHLKLSPNMVTTDNMEETLKYL